MRETTDRLRAKSVAALGEIRNERVPHLDVLAK